MSTATTNALTELTFDPTSDAEWEELRALGHRMVDDMLGAFASLNDKPVWQPMPDETRARLSTSAPREGIGADAAYQAFLQHVLPYPQGCWHPRFFGWVQGNGTPLGMFADMLASGLNANLGGFDQAPALVERQAISWFSELFDIPGASGLFVTGGTLANTLGLSVSRFAVSRSLGRDVRRDGAQSWPGETPAAPLVFYGSGETHGWARKGAELLGLGDRAFRRIPVNDAHEIDCAALETQIALDRAAGLAPFCIIGTAGTVNIGASDDLEALAVIARREKLWFHVDGAFGALAYLSPALRPRVAGMRHADSIAFDLHKWGSLPYECACLLVRDPDIHREAFATPASYLAVAERGPTARGGIYFSDRGIDLSRSFKALKVWMSLTAVGTEKLARIVEQNVAQCVHLADRIDAHPELERLAPVPLNIVCFRYCPEGLDEPALDELALDALNRELLVRLQERGFAMPSSTLVDGRYAIRVANVNHRSKTSDFDALLDSIVALGREVAAGA